VAFAEEAVAERIGAGTPTMKRWGGWVLVVVGVWFVLIGVFADAFSRLFPV
jgi:hypothetical protein